jgi:hypothetical protein
MRRQQLSEAQIEALFDPPTAVKKFCHADHGIGRRGSLSSAR